MLNYATQLAAQCNGILSQWAFIKELTKSKIKNYNPITTSIIFWHFLNNLAQV